MRWPRQRASGGLELPEIPLGNALDAYNRNAGSSVCLQSREEAVCGPLIGTGTTGTWVLA